MMIKTGTYEIDRGRLVRWANLTGHLRSLYADHMLKDLIETGETILTVEELLQHMHFIPGHLFNDVSTDDEVYYMCVKIIYNKEKRTDLDEIDYKRGEGV